MRYLNTFIICYIVILLHPKVIKLLRVLLFMPHQCTKCGIVFPDASEELLTGCSCGSRFFYYIKQEKMDSLEADREVQDKIHQLDKADKIQIEKDIREISGMEGEPDKPVILDLESVKVLGPGKFEIDIINLFAKKRPLIYKLEEGKYIIDLSGSFKRDDDAINRKIKNPDVVLSREEKVERVVKGGSGVGGGEVVEDSNVGDVDVKKELKESLEVEDDEDESGEKKEDEEYVDLT